MQKNPRLENLKFLGQCINYLPRSDQLLADYLIEINNVLGETPIFNLSVDPWKDHPAWLSDKLKNYIDDFLILSCNLQDLNDPKDHIIYYPYWFLNQRRQSAIPENKVTNTKRKYIVSCLNRRARIHRIENYVKLKRKLYQGRLLLSMHNDFNHDECENGLLIETNFCDPQIVTEFNLIRDRLPASSPNDHSIMHPAYLDTYVNLVTETSIDQHLFVSEKIWKPLMSGQFGLYLGSPGTVAYLKSVGFDLFDDYIDHSYDYEPDWHKRIDMLHCVIDRIVKLDWVDIFEKTADRRLSNQKLFYSTELYNKITKHLL